MRSFIEKVEARESGICLYGIAPPKQATGPERLSRIARRQCDRIRELEPDGLIVYDIQDEAGRVAEERPFPFLPTIDPHTYAHQHLEKLELSKIVYRSVGRDDAQSFERWMTQSREATVLVGAPSRETRIDLSLSRAYALARSCAPERVIGGIAIAERHARHTNEHERMLAKIRKGCRFFVTQAVYDVTATKSLISDYALALREAEVEPPPLILTFAPCASDRTRAFMQWLGISFPRWLENELKYAADPLATSLRLCEATLAEVVSFADEKGVPVGINVESVSIRKVEIEASVDLFRSLRRLLSPTRE